MCMMTFTVHYEHKTQRFYVRKLKPDTLNQDTHQTAGNDMDGRDTTNLQQGCIALCPYYQE